MLYLMSNRFGRDVEDEIGYQVWTQSAAEEITKRYIDRDRRGNKWLSSALDIQSAIVATQLFNIDVPCVHDFGEYAFEPTEDIPNLVWNYLELGDEVLAILVDMGAEGTNSVQFYYYRKWDVEDDK